MSMWGWWFIGFGGGCEAGKGKRGKGKRGGEERFTVYGGRARNGFRVPGSGRLALRGRRFFGSLWAWLACLVPGYVTVVPFDLPDQKHFLAYVCLGFLFVMALRANWWQAVLVAVGLALVGFGVELAQDLIPKRYFRWVDVRANALGAVTGVVVGLLVRWGRKGLGGSKIKDQGKPVMWVGRVAWWFG
jgi:VanZ family protein